MCGSAWTSARKNTLDIDEEQVFNPEQLHNNLAPGDGCFGHRARANWEKCMNRYVGLFACIVSFLAGTLVGLPHAKAQASGQSQKRLYYQVGYMKTRPGHDAYKFEHELWGPIHRERLKNGNITSWAVMEPMFGGALNYDYVTVTGFHSLKDLEDEDMQAVANKVWGKEKIQAAMKQTDDTRDMLGSEIYRVVDSIEAPRKE
jgi:hypothetical protein